MKVFKVNFVFMLVVSYYTVDIEYMNTNCPMMVDAD